MGESVIEWTDDVWNPIVGCKACSPGCLNCYAARLASTRLARLPQYRGLTEDGKWTGKWNFNDAYRNSDWNKETFGRKPRRIFVCSMGDLFYEAIKTLWITSVMKCIINEHNRHHTFILLTKRAERMAEVLADYKLPANVWCGVSICNQEELKEKLPHLAKVNAAVQFISFEPMLERIGFWNLRLCRLDWLIIGCESLAGKKAGRLPPALSGVEGDGFIDATTEIVTCSKPYGVPVFVKQIPIGGKIERDVTRFPKQLQRQEWPGRAITGSAE